MPSVPNVSVPDPALDHFLEAARQHTPWPWFASATAFVDAQMAQDGGHDWGHLSRVLANARQLWAGEGSPDQAWPVIAAAVLFHDVVNLPKDSPERHLASTKAAQVAVDYLRPLEVFSASQLTELEEAIRCHSFSSGFRATSFEAQIVSDADRLDALGAVGAARTFAVGGALGRPLAHPSDPICRQREPDDKVWSVDHFFAKLFLLPELMYTKTGLKIAQARVLFMRELLDQLEAELMGTR